MFTLAFLGPRDRVGIFSALVLIPRDFFKWLYQFPHPLAVGKNSGCSTSTPTLTTLSTESDPFGLCWNVLRQSSFHFQKLQDARKDIHMQYMISMTPHPVFSFPGPGSLNCQPNKCYSPGMEISCKNMSLLLPGKKWMIQQYKVHAFS